jgi:hypothetical protein
MKKIFLGLLAIALVSSTAFAANDEGKKKGKKKAKMECKQGKCCDPMTCDPSKCDPKCCDFNACAKDKSCNKEQKCPPTTSYTSNK